MPGFATRWMPSTACWTGLQFLSADTLRTTLLQSLAAVDLMSRAMIGFWNPR